MDPVHGHKARASSETEETAQPGTRPLLRLRERIRSQETLHPLACWLEQVHLTQDVEGVWILKCPDAFSKEWLSARYGSVLSRLFREEFGEEALLHLEVDPAVPSMPDPAHIHEHHPHAGPRFGETPRHPEQTQPESRTALGEPFPGWNPRFRFSTFVTGPSNALAWSAAQEVSKGFRGEYNPLLIHGATGLGKTHLGQAIAHACCRRHPGLRILWSTAEGFFAEMIRHLKNRTILAFKERYREGCDLLILDDIQFLIHKTALQTELCHTLDVLLNRDKQVVLLGNLPDRDESGLDAHLESRIFSGLAVTVEPPGYETRLAILKQFAQASGTNFPEEVFTSLARRVSSHVRDLEGAFKRLRATQALSGERVTQATVDRVVQDNRSRMGPLLDAKAIRAHVARSFGLDATLLASRSRERRIHYPRKIGMYLARKHTHESLESIGRLYGRNHASVLYAVQSLEKKIRSHPRIAREVSYIEERLLKQA